MSWKHFTRRVKKPVYAFSKPSAVSKLKKKVAKIASTLAGVETKSYQQANNNNDFISYDNNMRTTTISEVAVGTGDGNRVGDRIRVVALDMTFIGYAVNTRFLQPQMHRILIVRDRQYDGATAPTGAQILASYDVTTNLRATNFVAPTSIDYIGQPGDATAQRRAKRFQVLYDKIITYPAVLTGGGTAPVKVQKIKLRFKRGLDINYSGATSLGGTLFMIVFPGVNVTALDNPVYAWQSRMYFKDL